MNGDGFSDVIVGADSYDKNRGRAFLFYGGINMDNIPDLILTGDTLYGQFGFSVSSAGDVNGDGFSDVIVGAFLAGGYYGKTYIYFGGIIMDNIPDIIMKGQFHSYFGTSVSSAGDVNGDGFSDVIVGADWFSYAYIYFGGQFMDSTADVILSEGYSSFFGRSVTCLGDVNNDGYSDVAVGNAGFDLWLGRVFIYYGGNIMDNTADVVLVGEFPGLAFGTSISGADDLNNDGYSDVIVGSNYYLNSLGNIYIYFGGSNMDNIYDLKLKAESSDLFNKSVSKSGDVNGDGYSDVLVASNNVGKTYIYYGGHSMDNFLDVTINNNIFNEQSVSGAGDLNGDGSSDIIIGSRFQGMAILYFNLLSPILKNPINNSINNFTTINFSWNKLKNTLFNVLYIATDSSFNDIVKQDTILIDTTKIIIGLERNKKYFWKVKSNTSSGVSISSEISNFTTLASLSLNLKVLFEGLYYPLFNQMSRNDTVTVKLRDVTTPYTIRDSSKSVIDSLTFSSIYKFKNAYTGLYYIVLNHFNCIDTWSKPGGLFLFSDGSIQNYDFTSSISQAFGNNLKLKGSKYCVYSGDVEKDGIIDISDIGLVDNASFIFSSGRYLASDLNGDNFVDISDITICDNNARNFVGVISP